MDWKNPVLRGFIKYYENEMSKETKKAPAMPASFFRHCELVMMKWYQKRSTHDALIIVLGTFMFMVIASLRYDDTLHINPSSIIKEEVRMDNKTYSVYRGKCSKTKTDQAGKKSFFTASDFCLSHNWMEVFFTTYFKYARPGADFFIMKWTLSKGAVTVDPCCSGECNATLGVLKAVLSQVCPGQERKPFHLVATWHSARCSMIQWGRDHGAKGEDLAEHMNSKTLAMADTYTRDKTILSLRLLTRINKGVRKQVEDEDKNTPPSAPNSGAQSKAKPKPRAATGFLPSNLKNSVTLPMPKGCPRCLASMLPEHLPGHMLTCRKVLEAEPDVLPESEYQWYEMLEHGKKMLHLADPMDSSRSACQRISYLDSLLPCLVDDQKLDQICPDCIGALPDAVCTFATPV